MKRNKITLEAIPEESGGKVDLQGKQYVTNGRFYASYRLPNDLDMRYEYFKVVVQEGGLPEKVDVLLSMAKDKAPNKESSERRELAMLTMSRGKRHEIHNPVVAPGGKPT